MWRQRHELYLDMVALNHLRAMKAESEGGKAISLHIFGSLHIAFP